MPANPSPSPKPSVIPRSWWSPTTRWWARFTGRAIKEGALVASRWPTCDRCGAGVSSGATLTAYMKSSTAWSAQAATARSLRYAERGVALARRTGLGGPRGAWMAQFWIELAGCGGAMGGSRSVSSAKSPTCSRTRLAEGDWPRLGVGAHPPGPPGRGPPADRTGTCHAVRWPAGTRVAASWPRPSSNSTPPRAAAPTPKRSSARCLGKSVFVETDDTSSPPASPRSPTAFTPI